MAYHLPLPALCLLAAGALAGLLPATADAQRSPLRLTGELSVSYDDNLSNAQAESDQAGSAIGLLALNANYRKRLTPNAVLLLRGTAEAQEVDEFEGLSNTAGTLLGRLLYRPGRGLYDPTVAVSASATVREFDSDIRDSTSYRLMFMASNRISTRIGGRLLLLSELRDSDSEVFDTRSQQLGFDIDFRYSRKLTLYGGYRFRVGDIVSSAQPTLRITQWAEVIEADEVYGGAANNRFAYRLETVGNIFSLGGNVSLTRSLALDVNTRYATVNGGGSNEYQRWTTTAGLLLRF